MKDDDYPLLLFLFALGTVFGWQRARFRKPGR